ncbi:MAG: 50S ribosomal protein L24 [Candidatus Eremiobacteraeota bacterium]|nr:50S ribosomal protein L24 [Candidatus Eremiobacteraeota bacterium]
MSIVLVQRPGALKTKIVKGDTVMIRRGKEKGKRGVVKAMFPKAGLASVEGLNVVKRHTKQGAGGAKSAGIFEKESPLPISALQYVCTSCNVPSRVKYDVGPNGKRRVCGKCGEPAAETVKGR